MHPPSTLLFFLDPFVYPIGSAYHSNSGYVCLGWTTISMQFFLVVASWRTHAEQLDVRPNFLGVSLAYPRIARLVEMRVLMNWEAVHEKLQGGPYFHRFIKKILVRYENLNYSPWFAFKCLIRQLSTQTRWKTESVGLKTAFVIAHARPKHRNFLLHFKWSGP